MTTLPRTKIYQNTKGSVQGHLIWTVDNYRYLEDYLLGGLYAWRTVSLFFFVFLSLSCLRGWINFLFATRWSTPFIQGSLCVIYDMEGRNDVNPQSTEFDPCR